MSVDRVTIHHEGAGSPTDNPRGADGGYSAWIGATHYTILRSPYISYATLNYNHVSFDICLSGDRHTGYPVTDHDVAQVQAACADARANGWLTGQPSNIVPHRYSLGSMTVCPGNLAMARWPDLAAACTASAPPPPPPPPPKPKDKEMLLVNCAGKPAVLLIGNAVRSIHDPDTLHQLQACGIPSVTVSAVDYDNLTR